MARTPDVVDGYRGPREDRIKEAATKQSAGKTVAIPDGKVVFQASAARYRIQLTAPEEQKTSDGRIHRNKALVAQFTEGFLTLDPKKKDDAKAIEFIREHPDYKIDFWDFSDVLQNVRERKNEELLKALADPESREVIRQFLEATADEDFQVTAEKSA